MTMPAWPFQLVHPAGYTNGDVPNGAELQSLQEQVAASADGRVFTDLAAIRNWKYLTGGLTELYQRTIIRDPVSRRWLMFGGTAASVAWTVSGARWANTIAIPGAPTTSDFTAAWANNAGVIMAGGAPVSASANKIRESTNGGDTWTARTIGGSNTQSVGTIAYSEALGLWFCSIGGNAGEGLYSSADRITWTLRTAAGTPPDQLIIRETPSPILLATTLKTASPTAAYKRSVDGITWTTETFPDGSNPAASLCQGCWSDALGAFFVGSTSGIYKSSTGLTGSWTLVESTWPSPSVKSSIAAYGRTLIRGDGKASIDGGLTWFAVLETTNVDLFIKATPFGIAAARDGAQTVVDVYFAQQIGF
jgi:hypothetical protein